MTETNHLFPYSITKHHYVFGVIRNLFLVGDEDHVKKMTGRTSHNSKANMYSPLLCSLYGGGLQRKPGMAVGLTQRLGWAATLVQRHQSLWHTG